VIGLVAGAGGPHRTWVERLAAACLAIVIVAGSALVWIGVPVAGFWVAAQVTSDAVGAVLLALLVIPPTMAAFGWLLYLVSARYEALRGAPAPRRSPPAWRVSLADERPAVRRQAGGRPLIDVAMTVSAVAALVVLIVWFFFFAELRLSPFP
jgi:hypothetical protein